MRPFPVLGFRIRRPYEYSRCTEGVGVICTGFRYHCARVMAVKTSATRAMSTASGSKILADMVPENFKPTSSRMIKRGPMFLGAATGIILGNFSSSGEKPGHMRLITIALSPFCEKARWALDIAGCKYTEDAHPPFFSAFSSLPASGGAVSAVPLLVAEDGKNYVSDSSRIIEHLATQCAAVKALYPAEHEKEIREFEAEMHQRLGATSRLYLYNRSLRERPNRGPTAVLLAQGSSLIERLIFPWMFKSIIYKGILSVTKARKDENAQLAVEEIRKVFSDVSSRLEGRQYLFGDRFTAADLTFASMSTLLVPPSNLDPIIPDKSVFVADVQSLRVELEATAAGRHVHRMYSKHRGRPAIRPESGARDRWSAGAWVAVGGLCAAAAAAAVKLIT